MSGYGWKNCRKLSAVVTVLAPDDAEYDDPLVKGPEQNAGMERSYFPKYKLLTNILTDSIALFGSGMLLI
jgi:hypothetical protein